MAVSCNIPWHGKCSIVLIPSTFPERQSVYEVARDFSSNVSKSEHLGSPDSENIIKGVAVHEESR